MTPPSGLVPALAIDAATIDFGGLRALGDVRFAVQTGSIHGVIGPNGAGKSTLFNAVSGLYPLTAGSIRVFGASVAGLDPTRVAALGVARTFQNIRLFPGASVLDHVRIGAHRRLTSGVLSSLLRTGAARREESDLRTRSLALLDRFGLADRADSAATALPYGEQRRLEIARALASAPRLLLIDEPAAGLNATEKNELVTLLSSLREEHALTIVVIEHDMRLVAALCERVAVLDHGQLIAEGTPAEIARDPAVIEAYLGVAAPQGSA